MRIIIYDFTGDFAENKDVAKELRESKLIPALRDSNGVSVILDFDKVTGVTQSFIHALISDVFRVFSSSPEILHKLEYKNCTPTVQGVIEIVYEYMQQADLD